MDAQTVKVYVYDITKGLARSMSMPLLGTQLDGVWHTGIVVYGQEYFFGGDGINSCPPGGTMLGQPDTVVDLGRTEIPRSVFLEYLRELSTSTFRGECYHLLDHNCNNFSDEVAEFLTGAHIPSHITSLPRQVLNTPLGSMMKPMIDAMSVNPGPAAHRLFSDDTPPSVPTQSDSGPVLSAPRPPQSALRPPDSDPRPPQSNPGPVVFTPSFRDTQVVSAGDFSWLGGGDLSLIREVLDYVGRGSDTDADWSLGRPHLNLLVRLAGDTSLPARHRQLAAALLQNCTLQRDFLSLLTSDTASPFLTLLSDLPALHDILPQIGMCVCNCASSAAVRVWLGGALPALSSHLMLQDDAQLTHLGVCLAASHVDGEVALDLGTALIHLSTQQLLPETGLFYLHALTKCIEVSSEVAGLARVMSLDVGHLRESFPSLSAQCDRLDQLLAVQSN